MINQSINHIWFMGIVGEIWGFGLVSVKYKGLMGRLCVITCLDVIWFPEERLCYFISTS